jgi:arginyl-tRNA synthetase
LSKYLKELSRPETVPEILPKGIRIEFPKRDGFGDISSPVALNLASILKLPPRKVAEGLLTHFGKDSRFRTIEIAGPGYLNFTFEHAALRETLLGILDSDIPLVDPVATPRRILLEFVSANPTGPLHVGHGRGAAYGDALARILKAIGHAVETEYYINDAGNQMEMLGRSTCLAWRGLRREVSAEETEGFLKGGTPYKGTYIKEIAELIQETPGLLTPEEEKAAESRMGDESQFLPKFTHLSQLLIMEGIREDLVRFGVTFDRFFSERTLHDEHSGPNSSAVQTWIGKIRDLPAASTGTTGVPDVYESEGALWLRTTAFGDDKDRVLLRSDGRLTYFAADIAYHADKIQRGHDVLIDVWGADHHGYIPRMEAAIQTLSLLLGHSTEFRVALIQLVNLVRDGKPVSMSTRGGEFVTLREVVDEVGVDATRFIYLTRSHESSLDFDLNRAREKSMDNPVYYVQYAHARVMSLLKQARTRGVSLPDRWNGSDLEPLTLDEEGEMIRLMDRFPRVLHDVASSLEVHPFTEYLTEMARMFHHYYFHNRILSQEPDDRNLMMARLGLSIAVGRVLRMGLELLGVTAPESM